MNVAPTVDIATDNAEARHSEEFTPCFESVVEAMFGTIGLHVDDYSSRRIAVRVPGADDAMGVDGDAPPVSKLTALAAKCVKRARAAER